MTKTITNQDLGIEAIITERTDKRFAVAIRDTDAGEILPTVAIFEHLESAEAFARICLEG